LQVQVPYLSILNNLAVFVIPCFIGVVVRKLRPAVGDRLGRMIKPLAVIFMAFLLTFGLYTNRYIYGFMGNFPSIIPPSILQPYLGFTFGFCIARFAARQPKYRAITIAIETGVQNVTIPMVMLQGSFPQPFGDIAAVMPVMTAHFTPIPLLAMWIGLIIYRRFFPQPDDQQAKHIEDEETEPAKAKAIEASKDSKNGYLSATANPRDSLLVKNGLTASALGRQFFAADQESVI
jgi:predicted Na+-dependent transporter